jgi:putative salt-induced outer membrane protein YdiY
MRVASGWRVHVYRWLAFITLLAIAVPAFGKRKDDVVIMKNGDKFTGEIKGLEYGELAFKSSYMEDSVRLDWKQVATLTSQDSYIVSLSDGERVTGKIEKSATATEQGKDFSVAIADAKREIEAVDVIQIEQREGVFWNQLVGSINYGLSFASGNNSTNSSLGADVAYQSDKNALKLATSSQFDSQKNASNTTRFTFDSQYARTLTPEWSAGALFGLLQSNQQDLELRSTYGGALVRTLYQTDRTALRLLGGAAYSHERYSPQSGSEPVRDNAEALLGVTFNTFRFKTLNITSQTLIFPSMSDPGRVRMSSQSNLRIELVRNFNWNFSLYENYDTRPPVNAPKNDFGATTSLGWTF